MLSNFIVECLNRVNFREFMIWFRKNGNFQSGIKWQQNAIMRLKNEYLAFEPCIKNGGPTFFKRENNL